MEENEKHPMNFLNEFLQKQTGKPIKVSTKVTYSVCLELTAYDVCVHTQAESKAEAMRIALEDAWEYINNLDEL